MKKEQKAKKILCLLLSLMMVFAITACAGTDDKSSASEGGASGSSTAEPSESEASDPASEPDDTNTAGGASFKIATVRWTDTWPTDFLKTGVMAELEEKHGVDISWQVFYNSDWAEQKSLLLASGDLPDAFWGSIALTDTDVAQNESYFLELTDLIAENMPNLTKIFEEDSSMKALVTSREGKILGLPKKLPLRPEVNDVMYINRTWLDALDLEMPDTIEDLEAVLEAFVTGDPNGNGQNDEYGYTAVQALEGDLRHIMAPFGTITSRETNYMGLTDGKPVFMPVQDNYKEAVKWVHGLYEKGLVDPECFTQDGSMVTAKTQDPGGSLSGIVFGWTADAQVGVNVADYEVVPALQGPDGKRYAEHATEYLDTNRNELLVTTSCPDPAKLLQWADDFYTDEVSLQTYYGSISDGKIEEKDGKFEVLVPEDGSSLDTSAWSFSFRDFGPKYMSEAYEEKIILPVDQGDGVKLAEEPVNIDYITSTFPVVAYTNEQLLEMPTLTRDIYEYVKAQYAHWVVDGGIEEEWDAYLAQLDAMGLQKLVAIQEDAYAVYIEALE